MNDASRSTPGLALRRAVVDELIDLRHAVLRQGLPRDEAVFGGDELPSARHYGAFLDGALLCCATLHLNPWEGGPAWQLRGMATAPAYRRRGVGRLLVRFLESDLLLDPAAPRLLWCNARTPALEFYRSLGWRVVSDVFDIPTAGPHVKMVKRLSSTPGDEY